MTALRLVHKLPRGINPFDNMKIKASDFADNLVPLQYGIPAQPTLQQSDCCIFQNDKAYTFSGDVFAITSCVFPTTAAVNYKQLLDVLKKYGTADVDVEVTDSAIQIKKSNSKAKSVTTLPYDPNILLSLSALTMPDPNGWQPLPASFNDAVRACESVVTRVKADEIISSINVTETCMEAASLSQIIRHQCNLTLPYRFLVRAGVLGALLKANPDEYQVTDKWFYLKSATTTFAMPIYRDNFIDGIDTYLGLGENKVIFPTELLEDIPLVKSVLDKGDEVRVVLKNGTCELQADGTRGQHKVECDMASVIDLSFKINPDLLQRILVEFPDCTVGLSGVKVQGQDFQYAASVSN